MKKLLIIVASLLLVFTIVLGGTALASKPEGTPMEEWELTSEIFATLESIGGNISSMLGQLVTLVTGVENIDSKIVELSDNASRIESKIDSLDSDVAELEARMVQFSTDSGALDAPSGTNSVILMGDYNEIRHVVVTISPVQELSEGDSVTVIAYWPGNTWGFDVGLLNYSEPRACKTFEFNADKWEIRAYNYDANSALFGIYYVVTTTYVPES